jgi:hypothetical protein
MRRYRRYRVEQEQPVERCPTCGHIHPGGLGVSMCGCGDCLLLFGGIEFDLLAPPFQERYRELRQQIDDN